MTHPRCFATPIAATKTARNTSAEKMPAALKTLVLYVFRCLVSWPDADPDASARERRGSRGTWTFPEAWQTAAITKQSSGSVSSESARTGPHLRPARRMVGHLRVTSGAAQAPTSARRGAIRSALSALSVRLEIQPVLAHEGFLVVPPAIPLAGDEK
jgi:hypothetical protein